MTDEEIQQTDTAKDSDIADELKDLGSNLKKAFQKTVNREKSKELQEKVGAAFDNFTNGVSKIADDAKSGDLEKSAEDGFRKILHNLNEKLKDYQNS